MSTENDKDNILLRLDEQLKEDYNTFHETLEQINIIFKNDQNISIPNQNSISFRTPIPQSIQNAYDSASENLVYFLHRNLETIINKDIIPSLYRTPTSSTNPASKSVTKSMMTVQNQKVRQLSKSINELAMAIFFSPIPKEEKILNDYLKKVKRSLKYLFKNLAQTNLLLNYDDNPFLSSILRLFTFTIILYAIVRKDKLDSFLTKMVNTEENDNARLIYFHAQDIDSLIQNFLRTPNQYSIRYHSEIKKLSEKLDNIFKSMEVFRGEFVAKPLNEEIEYEESEQIRPICLTRPVFEKKNERSIPLLNEDDYFTHLDYLYAKQVGVNPYGELLHRFDSCSVKKRPNRKNYILFDKEDVNYYQFH